MSDILADADHVGDGLYIAAVKAAASGPERAFRDVLLFHRDVLNGGLDQAIDNKGDDIEMHIAAFERVGLAPLAALTRLAHNLRRSAGQARFDELETLTGAYVAATYNLAYVSAGCQDDPDFPLDPVGDQVERIALRFARANRNEFTSIIMAAQENE